MKINLASPTGRGRAVVVASLAAASLAACGSSGSGSGGHNSDTATMQQPATVAKLAAMVPDDIKKRGTIVVVGAVYPPAIIQPENGAAPTGWDVQNAKSIAAVLGLKVQFKLVPFDGVVAGLQAGRYDAAVGELYVLPARTKVVTFVTNHRSTESLIEPANGKISGASETDLCGHKVAALLGSGEAALVDKAAKACAAAGKPALASQVFKTQSDVNLALNDGRIDAAISSTSQAAYTLSQTGKTFKLVAMSWGGTNITGIALARNASTPKLAKAMQAATNYLIKNGTLQKVLDTFNSGQGLIASSQILPSAQS